MLVHILIGSSFKLKKCLCQRPYTILSRWQRHTERVWVPLSVLQVNMHTGTAWGVVWTTAPQGGLKSVQFMFGVCPVFTISYTSKFLFAVCSQIPSSCWSLAVQNLHFGNHKHWLWPLNWPSWKGGCMPMAAKTNQPGLLKTVWCHEDARHHLAGCCGLSLATVPTACLWLPCLLP